MSVIDLRHRTNLSMARTRPVGAAEIDPPRPEGEMLAQKLRRAGVPVEQRTYPGVTHAFFGLGAAVGQAKQDFAAMRLKASFVQPTAMPAPRGRPMGRRG